jgi:hypothetical protein
MLNDLIQKKMKIFVENLMNSMKDLNNSNDYLMFLIVMIVYKNTLKKLNE